eukprot:7820212-Pyramimonas_sp.AAC.1
MDPGGGKRAFGWLVGTKRILGEIRRNDGFFLLLFLRISLEYAVCTSQPNARSPRPGSIGRSARTFPPAVSSMPDD